jgi:hypothetical protein
MVRRSTVDRSPQLAMYEAGYEAGPGNLRRGKAASGHVLLRGGAAPAGAGWSGRSAWWCG